MTLYEILGVLPGASRQQIERAYRAQLKLLSPAMIAGSSTKVLKAVDRARATAEQAWRVLGDPAARERYDLEAGLRTTGTGLERASSMPSEAGWDLGPAGTRLLASPDGVALVLGALDALAGWLAPDPGPSRRVVVPDVRGLFAGPGQRAAGGAGLRLQIVRLTANPMPVEGLIVDQSPAKDAKVRRFATLTVQVWHPAARPAGWR
ncbi:MAG TPA: DnaJ domain-containing protein [Streptosporangiaceae bacterium]